MCKTPALATALFFAVIAAPAGASPPEGRIYVCSGYGCSYKTRLDITQPIARRFASIMVGGRASAEHERAAIARAVQFFETQTTEVIGVADKPKGDMGGGGAKGQMDCIDESTNTRALLEYLEGSGLLHHHQVERNASRGFFLDMRYPHMTAVIRDESGVRWAVDSWYEPAGGPPDIMHLDEWRQRGVRGKR